MQTNIVDVIEDIFARCGSDSYLGEAVTMEQHMLQAAFLAEQYDSDNDSLICAALLHDIGHYTSEFPADMVSANLDNYHEAAGADLVHSFFPVLVTDCVRHHVAAKRYLCAVDSSYYDQLSQASKDTLRLQGGPMSEAEAKEFAALSNLEAILKVRRWDDQAKDPTCQTPLFSHYKPRLQRLAQEHTYAK